MDIIGKALIDYQGGNYSTDITTYSSLAEEDIMPLPHFFRAYEAMPEIEKKALSLCKGKVLDIGCGAGSHSLVLQEKGIEVTALDQSVGAIECCRLRGIKNCVHSDVLGHRDATYDTLLLLMNGIGIAGTLKKLDAFLAHFKSLLNSGGQILLDSSDIIYMFDEDEDGGRWIPAAKAYYGELTFSMEYKAQKTEPFEWLYIDYNTLERAANAHNFNIELVSQGEHFDYLARLTLK